MKELLEEITLNEYEDEPAPMDNACAADDAECDDELFDDEVASEVGNFIVPSTSIIALDRGIEKAQKRIAELEAAINGALIIDNEDDDHAYPPSMQFQRVIDGIMVHVKYVPGKDAAYTAPPDISNEKTMMMIYIRDNERTLLFSDDLQSRNGFSLLPDSKSGSFFGMDFFSNLEVPGYLESWIAELKKNGMSVRPDEEPPPLKTRADQLKGRQYRLKGFTPEMFTAMGYREEPVYAGSIAPFLTAEAETIKRFADPNCFIVCPRCYAKGCDYCTPHNVDAARRVVERYLLGLGFEHFKIDSVKLNPVAGFDVAIEQHRQVSGFVWTYMTYSCRVMPNGEIMWSLEKILKDIQNEYEERRLKHGTKQCDDWCGYCERDRIAAGHPPRTL